MTEQEATACLAELFAAQLADVESVPYAHQADIDRMVAAVREVTP